MATGREKGSLLTTASPAGEGFLAFRASPGFGRPTSGTPDTGIFPSLSACAVREPVVLMLNQVMKASTKERNFAQKFR